MRKGSAVRQARRACLPGEPYWGKLTRMSPSPECPACLYAHHRAYFSSAQWRLQQCEVCGLVYLDPLPGPAELAALYTDAYDGATAGYFAKAESKLRRAGVRMRIMARLAKRTEGNFLDIGCNGGFMTEMARARGFKAWGLDIDPVSIEYAAANFPGGRFFAGPIEDFAPVDAHGLKARFDLVYCSEVIEHVPEPRQFLERIFQLLSPGGMLYLTTPDISHWRRPRDLNRWDAFCPPSHCLYFTPPSLIRLALSCGFALHSRRPAWKPGIKLVLLRPLKS